MTYDLTPHEEETRDSLDQRLETNFSPLRSLPHQYYGPNSEPISFGTWAVLFGRRKDDDEPGSFWLIGRDDIRGVRVSTIWLGLDHSFGRLHHPGLPPLIFETMVFGGKHDQFCERWPTREAALAGHDRIVAAIRDGEEP
jgi:hypothetical protein